MHKSCIRKNSARGTSRKGLGISARGAARLANRRGSEGVAPHHMATLVYPFVFSSSSMTGNEWSWQFRLNSLFDPDFTGTGAQPTTFDQWSALYDRYRVLACEADISVVGANGNALTAAFAPGVDAAPTLTFQGVAGDRNAVIGHQPYMNLSKIKRTYLIKDIFGIDEEAMMSELNYSGTPSTSAPSVAYLNVVAHGYGATDPIFIHGSLRFAVRFENPHDNNISLSLPRAPRFTPSEALRSAVDAANASSERIPSANVRGERDAGVIPQRRVEAVLTDDYAALPPTPRQAGPLQAQRR